jgi:peptide/nickel transport system substrate-binding protein
MSQEEFVPNERLRRARSLKGWSQADLAQHLGTSFEMVSRWERGVTVPSFYYRERLCAVLGQTVEELGLTRGHNGSITPSPSPHVFLASSHIDAEKPVVSHLKTYLEERGIMLWSSRQLGRQAIENARTTLREVVRATQSILVIVSPEARSSRHVRDALEMASIYQRPVCGVWIKGEHWQHCLPEGSVELAALIDAREGDTPAMLQETARALKQVWLASQNGTEVARPNFPDTPPEGVPFANLPTGMHLSTNSPEQPAEQVPPQSQSVEVRSPSQHSLESANGTKPLPAVLPLSAAPIIASKRLGLSSIRVGLLVGLAILVIAGGILSSLSLFVHFGVIGARSSATASTVVRGGTWTQDPGGDPVSLIPNGDYNGNPSALMDQALYLPLFSGDAQGLIHPGAASEMPSIQNGGVSPDATTWTFHLRPHLVWSDGQPYDARDVDFTWQLWRNPKFGAVNTLGLDLISSAKISADNLSITFHLKRPFAPFLADLWVDGVLAPLPEHHFISMAPQAILKSPENLNPQVTSGPFMMRESVPGDHYTLVRNPGYYRASEGLPYLDKVVFFVTPSWKVLHKDLETGFFDATGLDFDINNFQTFQRLKNYTITYPPANNAFEALYFNFHNTILASHQEVRQAMALAVDQQALVNGPLHGFGSPLCTDHTASYHPGFEPNAPCPVFDLAVANKLLDDNGWVRGPDGVRAKGGQRLEFEYSTQLQTILYRIGVESIVQRDFRQIGIRLDIQNYPASTFFGSFLPQGKASPTTGAVAARYDIAEFENNLNYDPDDSILFACNQVPPVGFNFSFYCNPALDGLYAQEQATADPGVRQQIFIQIHRIYLTQFPFIVLYSPTAYALLRKGTHNYLPGPFTDTYNIWEWWCDGGRC